MNCVLVGASAGLGLALAERLAAGGHVLFLVASDERDLAAVASDLRLRHRTNVGYAALDLASFNAEELTTAAIAHLGAVDCLFVIAGLGSDEDIGTVSEDLAQRLMAVNFNAGVKIVNAFRDHLSGRPRANCVGIGSVAAIRGRGSNMIYGASKRGLEFYFEALRYGLADTPCRVQFYRVGFMATSMLGQPRTPLPAASPEWVAARIVANLDRDLGVRYLPGWWRWIAVVLGLLPWRIFKRLKI